MLDLQAMVIDRAIGTKARRAARGGATRSAQERRWRRGDPRPFKGTLGAKALAPGMSASFSLLAQIGINQQALR